MVAVLAVFRVGEPQEPESPVAWVPDLVENFDSLDRDLWTVADGWGADNESSWLLDDNVSVKDGILRIEGKPEEAGGRDYTSGRLDTNDTYALPDYFRAEVRARVSLEQGMWSAPLWLRPVDDGSGEIDLIETYGAEADSPTIHQTIHSAYGSDHEDRAEQTSFEAVSDKEAHDWHTYTVEKVPGKITMWVDGVETASFDENSAPWFDEYYEAGQQWNLRVNLQIGGSYGLPDDSTRWGGPTTMQVDYIRTWVPE